MASQQVIDLLSKRVWSCTTPDALKKLWTECLGDSYKSDPDVIRIFRDRKKQLD